MFTNGLSRRSHLVTDEDRVLVLERGLCRRAGGPGPSSYVLQRHSCLALAGDDLHAVACDRSMLALSGGALGECMDESSCTCLDGGTAHARMRSKVLAKPGSLTYLYEDARCWASGRCIVYLTAGWTGALKVRDHYVRVVDQRRLSGSLRPVEDFGLSE